MSVTDGGMVLKHTWLSSTGEKRRDNNRSAKDWGSFGGRKSAVELLQETKGRYVKSGSVLETTQHPDRPDHLKISAPARVFPPPRAQIPISSPQNPKPPSPQKSPVKSPEVNIVPLTSDALDKYIHSLTSQPIVTPRISRAPTKPRLRPRAKTQPVHCVGSQKGADLRRSMSHGPSDLQSKLRRLLNAESKENISPHSLNLGQEIKENKDPEPKTHKSLPNLIKMEDQIDAKRRPSCPARLDSETVKRLPPPVPPRPKKPIPEEVQKPPSPPPRCNSKPPPPRPPPPKRLYSSKSTPSMNYPSGTREDSLMSVFKDSHSEGAKNVSDLNVVDLKKEFSEQVESVENNELSKRPVVRSVSDVTHTQMNEISSPSPEPIVVEHTEEETRIFFEYLGLDEGDLKNSSCGTPPVYFDTTPSSGSHSPRRNSSDSGGEPATQTTNTRNSIEPSIIEKNARIIKWLFQMQKARAQIAATKS